MSDVKEKKIEALVLLLKARKILEELSKEEGEEKWD